MVAPRWLDPYVQELDRSCAEPVRVAVAAPPQHTKTTTTHHAIVQRLIKTPGKRNAYVTFSDRKAKSVEQSARIVAQRLGLAFQFNKDKWFDPVTGSSVTWGGGPSIQGEPIDGLLVLDDLLSGPDEARSRAVKDQWREWLLTVAIPRLHRSASLICMATRWADDDPTGVLLELGYRYINLQALAEGDTDDDGVVIGDPLGRHLDEALWPERKSTEELKQIRSYDIYAFSALWQGAPRAKGADAFAELATYTELPKQGFYVGYGVDLASTASTAADWSVCIRGLFVPEWHVVKDENGNEAWALSGKLYITEVVHKQVEATSFVLALHAMQRQMPGPMLWYAYGMEKAVGQFVRERVGPNFAWRSIGGDKFVRSAGAREASKQARILVPGRPMLDDGTPDDRWIEPAWVAPYRNEVASFTGVQGKDLADDQVDATSALWDLFTKWAVPKRKRKGGVL